MEIFEVDGLSIFLQHVAPFTFDLQNAGELGTKCRFFSTAEASSLQKISYREYNNIMKSTDEFTNYLLASDFLLAVFCPEGIYNFLIHIKISQGRYFMALRA